jgi:hypothetical protein
MEHYVTLFDSLFLPQGLALHMSMERHAGAYTLWILCMDERGHDALQRLHLPNVRLIALADVESPELLQVKPTRSRGEYCWTMTPFTPKMVFDRDSSVQRVTYLDADLWFRQSPCSIFAEFDESGKAVLITEHAYAPQFDQSHTSGKFCVQFTVFVRERSEPVRECWADQCIDWCYARLEDGKFGDQMYLNEWPTRFGDSVHVLERKEWVQGPWNTARFPPSEAVAFHFHGLRLFRGGKVLLTDRYPIFRSTSEVLYKPYLQDLGEAISALRRIGIEVPPQLEKSFWLQRLRAVAKGLFNAQRRVLQDETARFGRVR